MKKILAALCTAALFSASAAPLTLDQALAPGGTLAATISPDGAHVAAILFNGTNYGLVLYDTNSLEARMIQVGSRVQEGFWIFNKAPRDVTWAGPDLLAVDYGIEAESITLSGKHVADLGQEVLGHVRGSDPASPNLLVYTDVEENELAVVNARTGERRPLKHPSGRASNWAFDKNGEPRAVSVASSSFWRDDTTLTNWYKPRPDGEWVKLAEFKITDDIWFPLYMQEREHTLTITSRIGRDTYAIFDYDTQTHTIGEMQAGHPQQDILGVGGVEQASFERVTTGGLLPQQVWLDPAWAGAQQSIDQALPNRINQLSGDPKKNVLVFSYSATDPGSWYLIDMRKGNMREFATAKPSVKEASMRPVEITQYRAADGLTIPAFLTRPQDTGGPQPTVVLIHGGPTARDYWRWNAEVQILASHGYVVFQPQFRGSSGFGKKFEQAGYGQWGLAMQDDITAGVQDLIARGISDPKRICIVGASYGGYAALWGLAKTPQLYRCGVSFAGVADIEYMFRDGSDSNRNKIGRQFLQSQVGDLNANKEQFDSVSPLKHADRIQAPVLLMHGDEDVRVPISHGKKMRRALEALNKPVQWQEFEEEGHGLVYVRNQRLYYETLLNFLDKNTQPAPAPAP